MSFVRRWLLITVLGFSGGIIFLLPFLFEVFYTPLGSALGLSHTELGGLVSIFGFFSMLFYFPGGWLADRVSTRKMITTSLLGTGLAGLYFSTFPSYRVSLAIHAFWGACITLLFWGAISVARMWLKPVSGLVAGFVADRFGVAISTTALFAILVVSFLGLAALSGNLPGFSVMLGFMAVAAIAIFALRGIYFALLEEGNVPLAVTGTAGGVISAVAFTPDVFMPLLSGALRDAYPGAEGYRYLFLSTAGICAAGLIASVTIYFKYVRSKTEVPAS